MSTERKTAKIVGVLYIIGTIAGILSNIVSWGFLDTPDYLNTIASHASRPIDDARTYHVDDQ